MNRPTPRAPAAPARWRRALGVPDLSGQGRIVAATALDTFGAGMFTPLSFLFFLMTTDLTVAQVGLGTSVATLLSIPLTPIAGMAVDRWGPRVSLISNNLLAATGYLCYLLVDSLPALVASMLVVLGADRMYWAAWPAFVADLAEGAELDRWYAFTAAGKNASVAVGGVAGGLLLAGGWSGAAALIVVLNASTSVVTALLFWKPVRPVRPVHPVHPAAPAGPERPGDTSAPEPAADRARAAGPGPAAGRSGWRAVFADRILLCVLASQTALAFGWLIPTLILPVYLVKVRDLPAWLPSTALTANALLIVAAQSTLTARLATIARSRVISWAAVLILAAVGLLALLPLTAGAVSIALVLGAVLAFTTGQMTATPAVVALSATLAPAGARGRFLSLFNLTWTVSATTGPALVGALVERQAALLWVVLACLVALGGLGYRFTGGLAPHRLGSPRARSADA
ncbi:MFS transporter [Streptomyces sp. Ag109_G2-6]|uniref:MFS transporter n=1 Tax=Streptomyces sp. Ag109_G2-6 TaxID=2485154 RepID=UPI000FB8886A|nr:MFS transporter [Streptomyces sp. Ag109_G2-6]RPF29970.1 MFS transporter [Streptomyces sp. Ag109_G2-6]